MSFKGKKNIYLCPSCGHGFVSLDVDDGTTPFMTKCLNCNDMAQSMFYAAPQEVLARINPALEWYSPSPKSVKKMSPAAQQHCARGGLISRLTGARGPK